MNLITAASRLRFMARELMDEASRHRDDHHRPQLTRAAQQCAACAINIMNLIKQSPTARELRSTKLAAEAVHDAAIELLVAATLIRTPALHQEGSTA